MTRFEFFIVVMVVVIVSGAVAFLTTPTVSASATGTLGARADMAGTLKLNNPAD